MFLSYACVSLDSSRVSELGFTHITVKLETVICLGIVLAHLSDPQKLAFAEKTLRCPEVSSIRIILLAQVQISIYP